MLVEICANSYQSAINAQKAGAHRIELCSELNTGGITPSFGLLQKISKSINIPVHVLIRPRSGDFCYSKEELEQMKDDISLCKQLNFQGIVCGVLNKNNTIDVEKTKELLEVSRPLSFTFHRAFDCVKEPKIALKKLINLGIDRVLTSGKKETAIQAISFLNDLNKLASNKIIILPGSGINATNLVMFKNKNFKEIHASASKNIEVNLPFFDTTPQTVSDLEKIKELVKLSKNE